MPFAVIVDVVDVVGVIDHLVSLDAALQPAGTRCGAPFYSAQVVAPVRMFDDPTTGLVLGTATFHAVVNFTDESGAPLESAPVGEPAVWFAIYDPGAKWFPRRCGRS